MSRDTSGRVTAATWTGSLPPKRFVEFPFVAVNPREKTTLVWPVHQTYSDGERVGWTGPENGDTPASVTMIGTTIDSRPTRGNSLAGIALALAAISLAFSVRNRRARAWPGSAACSPSALVLQSLSRDDAVEPPAIGA